MEPITYYNQLLEQIKDEIDKLMIRTGQEGSDSHAGALKINRQGMSDMLSFMRLNPPVLSMATLADYISHLTKICFVFREQTKTQLMISRDDAYARSWNSGAKSAEQFIGKIRTHPKGMTVLLGNDRKGEAVFFDLQETANVMISGISKKEVDHFSTCLLSSLLIDNSPEDLKMIIIDSDQSGLSMFDEIPHLSVPVIHNLKKAANAMQWIISETENRLNLIQRANAADIHSFNVITGQKLADVIIVLHDLADFMVTHPQKTEHFISWIAEKGHPAGIHLVVTTCRPSVYVITGLIKEKIQNRLCFKMPGKEESKILIDAPGAEDLNGTGDMLYFTRQSLQADHIQGVQFSQDDIRHIIEEAKKPNQNPE